MILIILDYVSFYQCLAIVFAVEWLRIIIAYMLAKLPTEYNKLTEEKLMTQIELTKIKSVQLEFVRHSLLSRKVIKIEKQLETIQSGLAPKASKVKNALRILRVNCNFLKSLVESINTRNTKMSLIKVI